MFIALLIVFCTIAFTWGAVTTLASMLSWRAFLWVTLAGSVGMAMVFAREVAPRDNSSPSTEFMNLVLLAAFIAGTVAGAAIGLLIRYSRRVQEEARQATQAMDVDGS